MTHYRVKWSFDVDAESEFEAGWKARRAQLEMELHHVGFFKVVEYQHNHPTGRVFEVDLAGVCVDEINK